MQGTLFETISAKYTTMNSYQLNSFLIALFSLALITNGISQTGRNGEKIREKRELVERIRVLSLILRSDKQGLDTLTIGSSVSDPACREKLSQHQAHTRNYLTTEWALYQEAQEMLRIQQLIDRASRFEEPDKIVRHEELCGNKIGEDLLESARVKKQIILLHNEENQYRIFEIPGLIPPTLFKVDQDKIDREIATDRKKTMLTDSLDQLNQRIWKEEQSVDELINGLNYLMLTDPETLKKQLKKRGEFSDRNVRKRLLSLIKKEDHQLDHLVEFEREYHRLQKVQELFRTLSFAENPEELDQIVPDIAGIDDVIEKRLIKYHKQKTEWLTQLNQLQDVESEATRVEVNTERAWTPETLNQIVIGKQIDDTLLRKGLEKKIRKKVRYLSNVEYLKNQLLRRKAMVEFLTQLRKCYFIRSLEKLTIPPEISNQDDIISLKDAVSAKREHFLRQEAIGREMDDLIARLR